jgi:hypothetical protein
MKTHLLKLFALSVVILFIMPDLTFAQPTLGVGANFVLFSSGGPVTSTNSVALPKLTGNVGSNGASLTGFGNVDGQMHEGDAASAAAATALLTTRDQIIALGGGTTIPHAVGLGGGESLPAGVYFMGTGAAATLGGVLTLTGLSTDVFVFIVDGALSINGSANVVLTGGVTACNVFWQTNGTISMVSGANVKGTFIAKSGAINMTGATIEGRALAVTGEVTIAGTTARIPIGCGGTNPSPTLTGPLSPTLGYTECFVLFTSTGSMTNSNAAGLFTGSIGSNSAAPTGFFPANITDGIIFSPPSPTTAAAAADLGNLYTYLNTLSTDITLLYPQQLGNDLVLTPHTYDMTGAAALTGNLYLNAQGNANAVFVIKISAALTTAANAAVILQNSAQAKNVFWKVTGGVSVAAGSSLRGTFVATSAIDLATGVALDGRGLSTGGAVSTAGSPAVKPLGSCILTGMRDVTVGPDDVVILYPNPFTTSTTILVNDASQVNTYELRIYNVLGKEVMNTRITNQSTTLETYNLPAGIYFYKMTGKNNSVKSGKLVSQQ